MYGVQHTPFVPAQAGAQLWAKVLGPRFRGDERVLLLVPPKPLNGWLAILSQTVKRLNN